MRSNTFRRKRWFLVLISALFFAAQLGAATHSLHLNNYKAEAACSFCMGVPHWAPGSADTSALPPPVGSVAPQAVVDSVFIPAFIISPRSSRGPPRSTLNA